MGFEKMRQGVAHRRVGLSEPFACSFFRFLKRPHVSSSLVNDRDGVWADRLWLSRRCRRPISPQRVHHIGGENTRGIGKPARARRSAIWIGADLSGRLPARALRGTAATLGMMVVMVRPRQRLVGRGLPRTADPRGSPTPQGIAALR